MSLTSPIPWRFDARKESIVDRNGDRVMYRDMPFSGTNADRYSLEGIRARANSHLLTKAGEMRDLLQLLLTCITPEERADGRLLIAVFLRKLAEEETRIATPKE